VFLLREVFDYPYDEVARIVGKSPENCRQILVRAHRHVQEGRRRFDVSREERDEVARRFLAAWRTATRTRSSSSSPRMRRSTVMVGARRRPSRCRSSARSA
jgi:Sigma-70, region 4